MINREPDCPRQVEDDIQRELATWLRPFDDQDDDGYVAKQRSSITIRISPQMLDYASGDDNVE